MPALAAAAEAGADLIEIDLKLTASGEVVLLHDDTLERLWGDPRAIADVTFADLEDIASAGPGAADGPRSSGDRLRIPSFEEALELADSLGTKLVLDVTSLPIGLATQKVAGIGRPNVVYCGNTEALAAIRANDTEATIALSWGPGPLPSEEIWQAVRPQFFNPEWVAVTGEVITQMHARDLEVCTWTVDDRDEMARLADLGVAAIISNEIATLVSVVGRDGQQKGLQ